ncbi:hypothetical protein R83H12_02774 [Fibrobacteria bacterium R8-3-H12]
MSGILWNLARFGYYIASYANIPSYIHMNLGFWLLLAYAFNINLASILSHLCKLGICKSWLTEIKAPVFLNDFLENFKESKSLRQNRQ